MDAMEDFSFVADVYNCCPAEPVRFYLRPGHLAGPGSAQVSLPPELKVDDFHLPEPRALRTQRIYTSELRPGTLLCWEWGQDGPLGELEISARVDLRAGTGPLASRASRLDADGNILDDCELVIDIRRDAHSLKYLPEMYHDEDFTSRFLMLFDSFWKPISQQIDHVPYYFDPYLTPPRMLPWLGSWFGLVFDEALPEARRRDLLARIFPIYARKGTRQALVTCLQMFTGGQVQIEEHRDTNFVLGSKTCLGYQVALGTQNRPHSFDVHVTVPAQAVPEDETAREQYRRRVETLIALYKPAHTVFHLALAFA